MSGIVAIRRDARKAVHAAFATAALYTDATLDIPVAVTVRWHNKAALYGDVESSGYAEIVARIDRVIFDREVLAALPLVPRRGGTLTLTEIGNQVLTLDTRDPIDGPVTEAWAVTRP